MASFVRFRSSPDGIAQVDRSRRGAVHHELRKVIKAIQQERDGLSRRLEWARVRSAAVMGTQDGNTCEREAADEERLCLAEHQMMSASTRLTDLNKEHDLFEKLLAQIPLHPVSDLYADGAADMPLPSSERLHSDRHHLDCPADPDDITRSWSRMILIGPSLWASINSERMLTCVIIMLALFIVVLC